MAPAEGPQFYRIRVCGVLNKRKWGRFWRYRTVHTVAMDEPTARKYALRKFEEMFPRHSFTATAVTDCVKIDSGDSK